MAALPLSGGASRSYVWLAVAGTRRLSTGTDKNNRLVVQEASALRLCGPGTPRTRSRRAGHTAGRRQHPTDGRPVSLHIQVKKRTPPGGGVLSSASA
jgi:hypothetical protein